MNDKGDNHQISINGVFGTEQGSSLGDGVVEYFSEGGMGESMSVDSIFCIESLHFLTPILHHSKSPY